MAIVHSFLYVYQRVLGINHRKHVIFGVWSSIPQWESVEYMKPFSERIDHHPLRAGYTIQVLTQLLNP